MERYALIVAVGIIGGVGAQKFHVPGGAVVGSMLGSGLVALMQSEGVGLTPEIATIVQIILGISLGMTFDRSFLTFIPHVFPLAVVSTLILMTVAVLMAVLASRLGLVDFGTALFGFSPGGMSGMAILAKTEGHNTPIVAFLHLVRIFTLFVTVPLLVRLFLYLRQ
ncbi:AbrB family transcriptional regulator [Desulforhopalus singaporensis]|uniref:Membrane protein AbrB duplication n=1 Tax=Desulforhopalus singaporensis TaxID=91360 RepID=A0A1H0KQZ8_9BACT|nr:AbrB family transcriptional regulator [Desulforhopalus singaporensis]SDO58191.1 hypothetical protein SAMN05660330_00590 [Desulforhopalus singaporensis]